MPKQRGDKKAGQTPKSQKLKEQLNAQDLQNKNIQNNKKQQTIKSETQPQQKASQQPQEPPKQQQQPAHHTKSQIKRQVSINSENFVMCKNTDFETDYQIIDKIGEGSFGSVFRVRHRVLKIDRALKKIKKNLNSKFSSFEEIQVLRKLDHSNILKIYQFYENQEYYMIVTEIFQGRQLFDQIINSQKITQQIASRIIKQVLQTLKYTHSLGIAHRDIKPENILVRDILDKNKIRIKIIDWGLGTLIREQYSDRVCGTPEYAAPEIFMGKYSVGCDMWSLGVLTFVMLTGNMPFKGSNTQETISQVKRSVINYRKSGFNDLSAEAKQFIAGLIQKDESKRLTASKALQQKWITSHSEQKQQPTTFKQTLLRLKQLSISNHFGAAVINLINNHFSSSEQKQKLEQIFKFLDTNGDGVLSYEQLINGYGRIYGQEVARNMAKEIFIKLDVNNSGTLEFSQFIAYGLRREKQKEKQKLKQAFDLIDEDKNGTISWREVGKILEGKLDLLFEEDMKFLLSQFEGKINQEINYEQFYSFMCKLLEKVDGIRQSKKRESQIKSKTQDNQVQKKNIEVNIKRTQSISEPIQNQVQKTPQKSNSKPKPSPKSKSKGKRKK